MYRNMLRTVRDDANYLQYNWGDRYWIVQPCHSTADQWMAVAKWGHHDELTAESANGLLDKIRRHYGPETFGYPFMTAS